jgi:hypothetical protein
MQDMGKWCPESHDIRHDAEQCDECKHDEVNSPEHYTQGGIECIDAIRAALTPEEFRGYCKGAILKYVWRERFKQGNVSLAKAEWYLREAMASGD